MLVVVILLVFGTGYLLAPPPGTGTAHNSSSNSTLTRTVGTGIMQCTLARFIVYNQMYIQSNTSYSRNSTQTTNIQTYLTTTTETHTFGYTTAFTTSYSSFTGVLALANITSCEYISG